LEGEGMPLFQAEGHGKLYVTYHVIFPATVDEELVKDLESAFQKRKKRAVRDKKTEL
jgi:DnaJ-class molecular chaperone